MATTTVIDGVDKGIDVIPPPLMKDEGDSNENGKYLLVVSGMHDFRKPGSRSSYIKVLFEVMISDDYALSDDRAMVNLLNDFQFYAVEGFLGGPNPVSSFFINSHSRHLGESNNGMAGFCFDGNRQIIVMPDKKIILPYEARPVFPFNEFRTSEKKLEAMCEDPDLLMAAAADAVDNACTVSLSEIPASKEGVPETYLEYELDKRGRPIPVL